MSSATKRTTQVRPSASSKRVLANSRMTRTIRGWILPHCKRAFETAWQSLSWSNAPRPQQHNAEQRNDKDKGRIETCRERACEVFDLRRELHALPSFVE